MIVPKLQKYVVKVSYVIPCLKNDMIGPSTQYAFGPDNTYRYRTSSTSPEGISNPMEPLLNSLYAMYSNVTYKHVKARFEPFQFNFALGGTTSTATQN